MRLPPFFGLDRSTSAMPAARSTKLTTMELDAIKFKTAEDAPESAQ